MNRKRCWLTHKRREPWSSCPLCGAPLKWVLDINWTPCDDEPVLYAKGGNLKLIKNRELIEDCRLYLPGDELLGMALIPHYYTCAVLKKERREWARKKKNVR